MRHSTLRQLEVFSTIARLGSFTRAAEELFLTQPTVSMQIKKLTDAVGLPLFEQIGKKMYLTDAGRELQQTCDGIFEHFSRFEMAIADMKGLKKGTLKLAVVTTAKYFAPRLLGPFCQAHSGVDVSLKVSNRERVLERLAGNQDDLYILGQPPEDIDAMAEPFLENLLVVLAPASHPLAKDRNIPLSRLAKEPFLVREPGSGTRAAVERLFASKKIIPKVRMELGSNEAIKQAIVGGLGISVLSRHTLSLDAPLGHIAILDVENFPIRRHWYVAYPRGKKLSVIAQAFLEYLKQAPKLTPM
ncbi:MAG: LysR family transcriptional regulator [Thiobacillus sp. 63-78]|uniref:LysR family transcriptional regulator n=1 Tax=Thiobacillus sp. 63-78 TaxID=1895859 RepID=UPI00086DE4A6|nr:LysR family transcriptional regulator [Thiobacillus sp. 63-78]MBN8763751.1 LysR family transcriptional regulator [Thiobacillus sp.]ODV13477.1 MAG: LysR family transcriptional regulator [Thiobacillus sp. SCN 64-317]MBN8765710.1 LysR family transcriptional regulator [Thiobacillus sp.]MBN8773494.1 LysR family transcriptional regulator [Thiobacillus sp.]OJZ04250.1 MAG: LysR family transcriptional regulator [Thiobacillus sp. 63-78]